MRQSTPDKLNGFDDYKKEFEARWGAE